MLLCNTKGMLADFFTKPIDRAAFLRLRKVIFNNRGSEEIEGREDL